MPLKKLIQDLNAQLSIPTRWVILTADDIQPALEKNPQVSLQQMAEEISIQCRTTAVVLDNGGMIVHARSR